MGALSVTRVAQGFTSIGGGGGGGGTSSVILTSQSLFVGVTDISHALGAVPLVALFSNSTGQTLVLTWAPKVGSETTMITVTSFVALTGVTIQLSTNA